MDAQLVICSCSKIVESKIALEAVENQLVSQSFELPGEWALCLWMSDPFQQHEVVLLLITREDLSDSLYEIIFKHHKSHVPMIVTLPVSDVHMSYLRWMKRTLVH